MCVCVEATDERWILYIHQVSVWPEIPERLFSQSTFIYNTVVHLIHSKSSNQTILRSSFLTLMNTQAEDESVGAQSTYWAAQADDGRGPHHTLLLSCRGKVCSPGSRSLLWSGKLGGVTQTERHKTTNAHWQVLGFTVGSNSFLLLCDRRLWAHDEIKKSKPGLVLSKQPLAEQNVDSP